MTKSELIDAVWNHKSINAELTKKACGEIVEATFDIVGKTIKKDQRFSYPGFGTWTVRRRKARTGRNPQTGEKITIKASKTVGFKPSNSLKEKL
jgi:DNA-binding protein HU-beta